MVQNRHPLVQVMLHLMQALDLVLSKGSPPPPKILSENERLKTIRRTKGKTVTHDVLKFTLFICLAPKYITYTIFTPKSCCLVNISKFQYVYDLRNYGGNWEVISFALLRKEGTAEAAVLRWGWGNPGGSIFWRQVQEKDGKDAANVN